MRESQTRSLFSHACAGKSTSREGYSSFLIEKCVEDIDSVQKDIHLKTDQEPAMIAFQARVQQARRSQTTPVNSPKGDHQANGRAEKGVQAFQTMERLMRLAVESHLGIRLPHKHPMLMWLIEWVGGAHNSFKDGRDDGMTPRERAGWQAQSLVMEFGEVVQFVPFRAEARADKFDAKSERAYGLGWTVGLMKTKSARAMAYTEQEPSRESPRTGGGAPQKPLRLSACRGTQLPM